MKSDAFENSNVFLVTYNEGIKGGVVVVTIASTLSLISILILFLARPPPPRIFAPRKTNLYTYITCFIIANILQSIGGMINWKWIGQGGVDNTNGICEIQGGLKQFGNVASSMFSMFISAHIFRLIFFSTRSKAKSRSKPSLFFTSLLGFGLTLLFVLLGPFVLQREDRGKYFSTSGNDGQMWCGINSTYPLEQIFLEYFLEFVSLCTSLFLYTLILLLMRGNIYRSVTTGRWEFSYYCKEEEELGYGRDLFDSSLFKVARIMVWFPITSAIILLPMSITRFVELSNVVVPFGFTAFVTTLYNLGGLLNAIQLYRIQRTFPDLSILPTFNISSSSPSSFDSGNYTQAPTGGRKQFRLSAILEAREKASSGAGADLTPSPYTLGRSDTAEKFQRQRELFHQVAKIERMSDSGSDTQSIDSTTLLLLPPMPIPKEAHTYTLRRSQGPSEIAQMYSQIPTNRQSVSSIARSESESMYSTGTSNTQRSSVPTLPSIDRQLQPEAGNGQWSQGVHIELLGEPQGQITRASNSTNPRVVQFGGPRRWI